MKKNKRNPLLLRSLAVISLAGFGASTAYAVDYTVVPGAGPAQPLDWNTDVNWTPTTPLAYPGTAAGDKALITGDFASVAQTVNLSSTPANPLSGILLGDTNATPVATTVSATAGATLPLSSGVITSAGTAGVVNTISAPITTTGNLTINSLYDNTQVPPALVTANTNDLAISGKITPSAAGNRSIINTGGKTVTFGDIDLSTGTTASTVTFSNNATSGRINLGGVLANGSTAASSLILNGTVGITPNTVASTYQIDGVNTYTGTTVTNTSVAVATTIYLNSNQPFGPGTAGAVTFGGNNGASTILEALNSDRTVARTNTNSLTMNRNVTFQGSFGLTLDFATIQTSNSPIFTNGITALDGVTNLIETVTLGRAGGRFNLNNNNTDKNVNRRFAGAGTTIVRSNFVDNNATPIAAAADSQNGIQMEGSGVLKLTGTSSFQGGTRITAAGGTIQWGDGGTTGSVEPLNGLIPVVTSNQAGFLAFNRSNAVATSVVANGPAGIKQNGVGQVTLSSPQFHTGANTVGDGVVAAKLVVNGSAVSSVSPTSPATVTSVTAGNLVYRTITFSGSDTVTSLNLKVGQPVYTTSPSANAYITAINSDTQISVYGISLSAITAGDHTDLVFGTGSALGTSASVTTVKTLSTLSGTGVIAGPVIVEGSLAPGASVGTLATGALTFGNGSTLAVEIDTLAGTNDKVVVTGDVLTGANTVNLSLADVGGGLLTIGQKLTLVDYSGTWPSTDLLTYAGNPVADGGSIVLGGHTFTVNYADPAVDGTALTLTVTAASITPYQAWINDYAAQLPNFADRQPTADPDHDGSNNLLEYALNGNPADGSNNGKAVVSTEDSGDAGSQKDLSLTLAVLNGAVVGAGPNGSATLTVGDIVYTIQGSAALQTWDKAINQVTPASTLVPAPDAGWTTYTFQVTDSNGLPDKRFIRVGVQ